MTQFSFCAARHERACISFFLDADDARRAKAGVSRYYHTGAADDIGFALLTLFQQRFRRRRHTSRDFFHKYVSTP